MSIYKIENIAIEIKLDEELLNKAIEFHKANIDVDEELEITRFDECTLLFEAYNKYHGKYRHLAFINLDEYVKFNVEGSEW